VLYNKIRKLITLFLYILNFVQCFFRQQIISYIMTYGHTRISNIYIAYYLGMCVVLIRKVIIFVINMSVINASTVNNNLLYRQQNDMKYKIVVLYNQCSFCLIQFKDCEFQVIANTFHVECQCTYNMLSH